MHNKKIKIRRKTCKYTSKNALHIPSYIIFPPRDFEDTNGRVTRWFLALQDYSFQVVHRPGRAHANADALSRRDACLGLTRGTPRLAAEGGGVWQPRAAGRGRSTPAPGAAPSPRTGCPRQICAVSARRRWRTHRADPDNQGDWEHLGGPGGRGGFKGQARGRRGERKSSGRRTRLAL